MKLVNGLLIFSQNLGNGTALKVELRAIMIGLQISNQFQHLTRGVIETNSSIAIKLILHSSTDYHPLENIIDLYMYLLYKLEAYILIKGSMHQNECA